MIRRDCLKAAVAGAGIAALPVRAAFAAVTTLTVYDGRYAAARSFAAGFRTAHDCRHDAAILWFEKIAPHLAAANIIVGVTTPIDAMILADCARREGLSLTITPSPRLPHALVAWEIR